MKQQMGRGGVRPGGGSKAPPGRGRGPPARRHSPFPGAEAVATVEKQCQVTGGGGRKKRSSCHPPPVTCHFIFAGKVS